MTGRRPRLLDLFCGAGGAAAGYHRAGFEVVGVDLVDQPAYPFELHRGDALSFLGAHVADFDVVHASPPCQFATAYRRVPGRCIDAPNLIPATRAALTATNLPYVIENVPQARAWLRGPVLVCGSAFGLDVQRHRLFESSSPLVGTGCDHTIWTPRFPPATNRTNLRRTVEVGVWRIPLKVQQAAMGIDWMTVAELSQAVPPAYTQHLGTQVIDRINTA